MTAEELAKAKGRAVALQCGTLDRLDRSRQYPLDDHRKIVEAVNKSFQKDREKEKKISELEEKLKRSNIENIVLTSIVTGLALEGIRIVLISFLGPIFGL